MYITNEPMRRSYEALELLANSKKGIKLFKQFKKAYVRLAKREGYGVDCYIQHDYDNSRLNLGCKNRNIEDNTKYISSYKLLEVILDYGVEIAANLYFSEMKARYGERILRKQNTYNLNKEIEKMIERENGVVYTLMRKVKKVKEFLGA